MTEFEMLAQGLLEYETLTGGEIKQIMAGEKLDRTDDSDTPPSGDSGATDHASIPRAGKLKPRGGP